LLDRRAVPCGIRKIELTPNENAEPDALPYTFVVNGRKMYVNGWNWVPIDVMYGVPRPQKLKRLFALAQRAHVNLLRVWGGGLIEKEAFYNLADHLGILVWQEFIQSSSGVDNNPPDNPAFIEQMVAEAEQIIPRKRNHPSLALWCGGNELQAGDEQPADDHHPMLAALKAAVRRLDPDRLWLATSPTGRVFSNSLENIERDPAALHDVHGPWEYQGVTEQYTLYNRGSSLLHSEFGVEGITNQKSLDATIARERQLPIALDNPIWQHLGAWWVKQRVWQQVLPEVSDVGTLLRGTQFLQASGLQYALEADRRRQYHNSGTLPWQFNEPYPMAACTSAVDYYAQPKPVYYAVAHAYEPVHVSAEFPTIAWAGREIFEAELWVSNSFESAYSEVRLQARIVGHTGRVYGQWAQQVSIPANRSAWLAAVQYPVADLNEDVFFLDLVLRDAGGKAMSSSRYVFCRAANLAPLLVAQPTTLAIHQDTSGDEWQVSIANTGANTALFVWLEDSREVGTDGYAYFSDNYFCLFPRESRIIEVLWDGVPVSERSLDVQAWNVGR
jgi:beta-mannosidase